MKTLQSCLYPTYSDQSRKRLLYCALVLECDVPILEALAFQWMCYQPCSNIQFVDLVFERAHNELQALFGPAKIDHTWNSCKWPVLDGQISLKMSIRADHLESKLSIVLFTSTHTKCAIFLFDKEGVRYLREDKKLRVLKDESMDTCLTREIQEVVNPVLLYVTSHGLD